MQPQVKCDPDLARRAILAWQRKCFREGLLFEQPGQPDCWRRRDGTQIVVLANSRGMLAVYRLRSDGLRIAEVKEVPASLRPAYD